MASIKYCPSCGSQNDPHNQFCDGCVATFSVSDPPSAPEVSTAEPQVLHETLKVTYASDGDRFVAFIIDSILFGLVGKLFGLMFGLVADSVLYLKAGEETRNQFTDKGLEAFLSDWEKTKK